MAGFTLQRREIVIKFANDTTLSGLEVTAKLDVPLSLFLEFQASVSESPIADDSATEGIRDAFTLFSEKILIDWNLEDEHGIRIEPTVEAFFELPPQACTTIIQEWSSAVSEPDPLPSTTSNNLSPLEKGSDELMVLSPANH